MDNIDSATLGNSNCTSGKPTEKQIENLLHFLDSEIDYVRDERKQPGWTKWAISGSIATLLWLLLNELGGGNKSFLGSYC